MMKGVMKLTVLFGLRGLARRSGFTQVQGP